MSFAAAILKFVSPHRFISRINALKRFDFDALDALGSRNYCSLLIAIIYRNCYAYVVTEMI